MAALVTLETAKKHLRVPADQHEHDEDIDHKVELSSAIILDYLKSRANVTATIETSSVANPTVITTEEAHGFANGNTATIDGHEDSVPAIFGAYVVSNVTEFTFTIPVNVTTAGTSGTAIVEWSAETAPGPVVSAVLLMLTHLYEHRGDDPRSDDDLWMAIGRLLMRRRDPALA